MAIIKRPSQPVKVQDVEKFIQGAPDGVKTQANDDKDSVQITLRISKDQLERVTEMAKRQGIPRASYIKRAIAIQLDTDDKR